MPSCHCEEYFFVDWQKIRLVLNDQQKPEAAHQFVMATDDETELFGPEFAPSDPGWQMNPAALGHMTTYAQIVDAATACTEAKEAEGAESNGDTAPREQTSFQTFTPPESLEEAMRCKASHVGVYGNSIFIKFSSGNYAVYNKDPATKITNQIQFCRTLVASDPLFHTMELPENYNTYQCINVIMAVLHDRQS